MRNTLFNVVWRLLSGPLLILAVTFFLTPNYQGYWFTFVSIAALGVFADLGFTTVVLQFSSNRFSRLKFASSDKISGNPQDVEDLAALFHFSLKWIIGLTTISLPIILGVGFFLLAQRDVYIDWKIPWLLYSTSTLFFLFLNVVLSFLEGCDSVAQIQKYRMIASMSNITISICALFFGFNLYSLSMGVFASCITTVFLILHGFNRTISQLLSSNSRLASGERKKIRHILARYAISFASGYFVFQAFTPIAFHYYGPVEAGQVGLSLSVWMAILSLSNVWIVSVTPKFNIFAAHGQYNEMYVLFKKNISRSVASYILGSSVFLGFLVIFKADFVILERLLDIKAQLQLALIFLTQVLIAGMATYVRAFLKEPFALISLVSAVFINVCSIYIGQNYTVDYLFAGMLLSCLVSLPLTYHYYLQARATT